MIRRANRFHGYHSVSKLRGRVIHGRYLSIRFAYTGRHDYRLAVVVSKKVAAKATARNRLRRQLFEAVRVNHRFDGLPIDAVVYIKSSSALEAPFSDLQRELIALSVQILALRKT